MEIVVHENLRRMILFSVQGAGCLGRSWGNFAEHRGDDEPLGGGSKIWGG